MIRQSAEVENDMNGVERIVHYANSIEQEPPHEIPDQKPPADWPSQGCVDLKDIVFKYRPELPSVLKGISISVKGGEKIGIVGRYVLRKLDLDVRLNLRQNWRRKIVHHGGFVSPCRALLWVDYDRWY